MLDANVIRGHLTTNVLLTLAEHDIVEPHWSQEVLVEARRNRPKRMSEEEFDRRLRAMNGFFPEAMASGYDDLKPHMLADDGDKHVLAAAVHGHCDTLVTENTKHFSPPASGAHAMRVSRLSDFLMRKLREQPQEVIAAMQAMVDDNRREPRTIPSLIDTMADKRMRMLRGFALRLNEAVPPELQGTSEILRLGKQTRAALDDIAPAAEATQTSPGSGPARTHQPSRESILGRGRDHER